MSRALVVAGTALGVGLISQQAMATSQTGHASAVILQAITITENTQLSFADISAPALGGSVVLTAAASPSETGTGFTFIGSPAAGQFLATGAPSQSAVLSFDASDTLTDSGSDTMTIGTFTSDAGSTPAFDSSGNLNFHVGATLTVAAAQPAGSYSGTYNVTVNY